MSNYLTPAAIPSNVTDNGDGSFTLSIKSRGRSFGSEREIEDELYAKDSKPIPAQDVQPMSKRVR